MFIYNFKLKAIVVEINLFKNIQIIYSYTLYIT